MPNLFKYNDYRKYLSDIYTEKKAKTPGFSYQNFSKKAGFASKSFIFNVIQGKKNLSKASIVSICEAIELTNTEATYFENLVSLNQAKSFKERDFYYKKLEAIKPNTPEGSKAVKLRRDQLEFYAKWYHSAIRSIIDLYEFKDDYKWLAKMVYPAITAKEAKRSIELLYRLGLVKKNTKGYYKITNKLITTGKEIRSLGLHHFHIQNIKLAEKALRELPKEKRNVSGLTLGMSQEAYSKVCDEIYKCQEKILGIAEKDKNSDGVYQLNFHLFPMSKTSVERKRA
jgi:uncharacterized protein (TIGR02147 family)